MSYDFAIWKRSDATKTAMLAEVYAAICKDRDHPAMAPFDLKSVERDLEKEFGGGDNAAKALVWNSESSANATWIFVHCSLSAANEVAQRIATIVVKHDYLLLYDPQRVCVWGNRRPPLRKTKTVKKKTVTKAKKKPK